MKTIIKNVPIYKTEKIKIGEKPETVYLAKDGTEFTWENQCIEYENKMNIIKDGEKLLKEVLFDYKLKNIIPTLLFDACNVSSTRIFEFIVKDTADLIKIIKYINGDGFSMYENQFNDYKKNDLILIVCWYENEEFDNETNYAYAILNTKATEIIKNSFDKIQLNLIKS